MQPTGIYEIMELARRARKNGDIFNPLFQGPPGLGKTEIIQDWAVKNNLPFIVITAATYEAPDLKGFPIVEASVNGRQRQKFALPDFWPTEGEGVVILEELNRGTPSVMNCFMSLTDKRRGLDGYALPEGWLVAACINPSTELYDTSEIDPALKDRFEFFDVAYNKKDHLEYMKKVNYHPDVINFVETGTWTYVKLEDIGDVAGAKYGSPRTLSKLNAALNANIPNAFEIEVYESILGKNMGKTFYQFKYDEQPIMFKDLVANEKKSLAKLKTFGDPQSYKAGHITMTIKDIIDDGTITDELLAKVVLSIPADQGPGLVSDLEFKRKDDTILSRLVRQYPEVKKHIRDLK